MNKPKVDILVKDIMKKKHVGTEELAQRLGISARAVSAKLNGNITLNALYDIAQALDCEIADFFPVPEGYRHWKVSGETALKRDMELFCPKCCARFTVRN